MRQMTFDFDVRKPISPDAKFPNYLYRKVLESPIASSKYALLPWRTFLMLGVMAKCQRKGAFDTAGQYRLVYTRVKFVLYTHTLYRFE